MFTSWNHGERPTQVSYISNKCLFFYKEELLFPLTFFLNNRSLTVVYVVAKPLIWSEAESNLVMIETSI